MSTKRRPMKNALTPDETAFVKGDTPESSPKPVKLAKESGKQSGKTKKPAPLGKNSSLPLPGPAARIETGASPALVTVTYRLPADLVETLARTSLERKLAKQKPYSQQDIAATALHDWLRKQTGK